MECEECYSDKNRITPLLGARECLENHLQYVCGTCGRCICIDKDKVCKDNKPMFKANEYREYSNTKIKNLSQEEVEKYLSEM